MFLHSVLKSGESKNLEVPGLWIPAMNEKVVHRDLKCNWVKKILVWGLVMEQIAGSFGMKDIEMLTFYVT